MRRVPEEAFLSTECVFRTVGGPLRYRMPQIAPKKLLSAPGIFAANPGGFAMSPKIPSLALTPHFTAFEDTHSGHLFYQPEMPIVPYRSLYRVSIYKKSTLHRCKVLFGAENGARTRDLNLGKVALYQLSYFRNITPYLAVGITKVRSFF